MCFSSKLFAASTLDFSIRILNNSIVKVNATLSGHQDVINGMAFYSATQLVTGSADRNLKVWDLIKTKQIDSVSNFP